MPFRKIYIQNIALSDIAWPYCISALSKSFPNPTHVSFTQCISPTMNEMRIYPHTNTITQQQITLSAQEEELAPMPISGYFNTNIIFDNCEITEISVISQIPTQYVATELHEYRFATLSSQSSHNIVFVLQCQQTNLVDFFIEWETSEHPSMDGKPVAEIVKIELAGEEETVDKWIGINHKIALKNIEMSWVSAKENDGQTGIVAVHVSTPNGVTRLD